MRANPRAHSLFKWDVLMRSFQISLIGLGCLALVGCVTQPGPQGGGSHGTIEEGDLTRIRGDELRRLVTGAIISRPLPTPGGQIVASVRWAETFHQDGSFVSISERYGITGTYRISADQLCSQAPSGERCRLLFRGSSGQYYMSYSEAPAAIRPIVLSERSR